MSLPITRKMKNRPETWQMDEVAMVHGRAFELTNEYSESDYAKREWVLTGSLETMREYQRKGYRCKGQINRSDFG